jgi:predicted N-acyltransferase
MSTHDKKQGHPHLNAACFSRLVELMPDRILTVIAYKNGIPVAGTFNFIKGNKLYGRYWGCAIESPNLHFECCYYQLIEVAIQRGLVTVEAGAMGDHKFFRGFDPEETYYAHQFSLVEGHTAVEHHVSQEAAHIQETVAQLRLANAYKHSGVN